MCCGVAKGGLVNDAKGAPDPSVPISNNLAVCNKDPSTDGKPAAVDWTGELKGADAGSTNIGYTFKGTDFTCFDSPTPAPPKPKPAPVYPVKGVGTMCTGLSDTCGDDTALCCGIAMNGLIVDDKGVSTGKNV
jgi:hypothetical protein